MVWKVSGCGALQDRKRKLGAIGEWRMSIWRSWWGNIIEDHGCGSDCSETVMKTYFVKGSRELAEGGGCWETKAMHVLDGRLIFDGNPGTAEKIRFESKVVSPQNVTDSLWNNLNWGWKMTISQRWSAGSCALHFFKSSRAQRNTENVIWLSQKD